MLPPELKAILMLSLLNPGTIGAGYLIGRRADQLGKLVVAGFAAGIAGTLFVRFLLWFGVDMAEPRLFAGVFVTSSLMGLVWGWLGYRFRPARKE